MAGLDPAIQCIRSLRSSNKYYSFRNFIRLCGLCMGEDPRWIEDTSFMSAEFPRLDGRVKPGHDERDGHTCTVEFAKVAGHLR